MSEQPHESVSSMSEARLRELHLYKELMTNEEARARYQELKSLGATPSRARQWRHWSPYHYQMMVNYLLEPPDLQPALPGFNLTELTA